MSAVKTKTGQLGLDHQTTVVINPDEAGVLLEHWRIEATEVVVALSRGEGPDRYTLAHCEERIRFYRRLARGS